MTSRHAHQCCGQPWTTSSGGASLAARGGDVQPDAGGELDVGVAHAGDLGEGEGHRR